MKRKYFGTDGIRGTVGLFPITPDFALKLAHAVGRVLKTQHDRPVVLIGKDTRISGYMLESALESGFNSAGVDVVLLGPVPTPAVAYLTRAQRADLGVVISASHNPFPDNGIKFFSHLGTKLSDDWELQVEAMLAQDPVWVSSEQLGKARRLDDAAGRYIEFCKSTFPTELSLRGLRVVVDAAHGAAYHIAPAVFHELGAQVIPIACKPDGVNINHDVGATHPEHLVQAVREQQADLGIALDGDADRLLMVDASGRIFNGDELLYVLADDRLGRDEVIPGVVGTLMTNMAIENALRRRGVDFVRAQVGDRYVLEALTERGWILGGEGSGHLLVLDKHSTGDGIVSALQVLQSCVRQGCGLAEVMRGVSLYPQHLINVRLAPDTDWKTHTGLARARAQVEHTLQGRGRVLIRASGTEPVLRIMVEADQKELAQSSALILAQSLS
jgi:phosphoglucosamine mutase